MKRAILLLLTLLSLTRARAEVSAPEVFAEFINGWVEYDNGAYASALRSFGRTYNLDPKFGPSMDGIRACLIQMGMPEVSEALLTFDEKSFRKMEYQPELAFWGIYHDAEYDFSGVEKIESQIETFLLQNVAYPIRKVSPSSQDWEHREEMAPCQFNLLVLLAPDDNPDFVKARFHLISTLDVSTNNSLDVIANAPDSAWKYGHSVWTLRLSQSDLAATLASTEAINELRGLIAGDWQNPPAPYVVDAETAALPDFGELKTVWEIYSKASTTENPQLAWIDDSKGYEGGYVESMSMQCGFLRWLHNRTPPNDPLWPWLLFNTVNDPVFAYFYREPDPLFNQDEILNNFADHPVGKAQRLINLSMQLSPGNKYLVLPEMLTLFEELRDEASGYDFSASSAKSYIEFIDYLSGKTTELRQYPAYPFDISFPKNYKTGQRYLKIRAKYNQLNFTRFLIDRDDKMAKAREANIILEINPYLEGNLQALIKKQQAMLTAAPDSAYLNYLTDHIRNRYRKEVGESIDSHFYMVNARNLINKGKNWQGIGESIKSLNITPEDRAMLADAMNRRLPKHEYTSAEWELKYFMWFIGRTDMEYSDLSPEARKTVDQLCEPFYAYDAKGKLNGVYFDILAQRYHYGEKDYVRNNILDHMPQTLEAMAEDQSANNRCRIALNLANYLLALGELEIAGTLIADNFNHLQWDEIQEDTSSLNIWFNLRQLEVERLHMLGRDAEALALIEETLPQMDGRRINSSSRSSKVKGPVAWQLLELKREILAAQQAKN